MSDTLKEELIACLLHQGAFDVKVCDPRVGFEHGIPGRRPLDIWPDCRSVVVIGVAKAPYANDTYIGPRRSRPDPERLGRVPMHKVTPDYALRRLDDFFMYVVEYEGEGFLQSRGYRVHRTHPARQQVKLCAYEAGLAVYGRAGYVLHPVLGNRLRLATIMTDAELEPDPKLVGYEPCLHCKACVKACPAQAHDLSKSYPESFDRAKCEATRNELDARAIFCNRCWAICPAGKIKDEDLYKVVQPVVYGAPQ